MRKFLTLTAALLAAVAVFVALTLPGAPASTAGSADRRLAALTIPGAYHVHSTVSDGAGTRDEIAAAAAAAGLQFVIFTDHGDGTRIPDPPRYLHGVLCIDAVEISSNGGHYVALDMRASSYPLGGEAAAVAEDVRRLGGFGIAAHPNSPKAGLEWRDWSVPIDGIEWLNADSEWRDETALRLARLLLDYLIRPAPAVASILDRPSSTIARWDELLMRGPVVGLAAHDAHGAIGSGAEGGTRVPLGGFPSYEASFRTFAIRAIAGSPLAGSPAEDARLVLDAIRRGRVFTAIDAVAAPAFLEFTATTRKGQAQMGDSIPFEPGVELLARSTKPDGGTIRLICGGREAAHSSGGEVRLRPDAPVACRPEVIAPHAPGSPPVPWIAGNAIQLLEPAATPVPPGDRFEPVLAIHSGWTVEKDPGSQGSLSASGATVQLDYQLAQGRASQYVALSAPLTVPLQPFEKMSFTAASNAPMRVSIQLRFPSGERWVHSAYVEPDQRRIVFPVSELVHAGDGRSPRPDVRHASSILFVIDLVNASPGSSGWIRIAEVALGR